MTNPERRLNDLEKRWRRPPSWKVWFAERTADGVLIEIGTGAAVTPGPNDTIVVVSTCPPGRVRPSGDAHEWL